MKDIKDIDYLTGHIYCFLREGKPGDGSIYIDDSIFPSTELQAEWYEMLRVDV
jgi:hypothetical protein